MDFILCIMLCYLVFAGKFGWIKVTDIHSCGSICFAWYCWLRGIVPIFPSLVTSFFSLLVFLRFYQVFWKMETYLQKCIYVKRLLYYNYILHLALWGGCQYNFYVFVSNNLTFTLWKDVKYLILLYFSVKLN